MAPETLNYCTQLITKIYIISLIVLSELFLIYCLHAFLLDSSTAKMLMFSFEKFCVLLQ